MDFDLEKMPGFGANGNDDEDNDEGGLADMVKDMMKSMFGDSLPESIEDLDPGELTNIMLDVEQQLGMFMGGDDEEEYDEVDFDELLRSYSPECEDEADTKLKEAIQDWLTYALPAVDDEEITMLGIEFDDNEDVGEMFFAYHDEDEPWDLGAWLDGYAGSLDEDAVVNWFNAKGVDIDSDDDGYADRIFDIIVTAVKELIEDGFIKNCFGREIPFVITDGRYDYRTALWTVKANGKEALDESFFEECGLYDDDDGASELGDGITDFVSLSELGDAFIDFDDEDGSDE